MHRRELGNACGCAEQAPASMCKPQEWIVSSGTQICEWVAIDLDDEVSNSRGNVKEQSDACESP